MDEDGLIVDELTQHLYQAAVEALSSKSSYVVPALTRPVLRGETVELAESLERFVLAVMDGDEPSPKKLVRLWRRKLRDAGNAGTERTRTATRCRGQLAAALSERMRQLADAANADERRATPRVGTADRVPSEDTSGMRVGDSQDDSYVRDVPLDSIVVPESYVLNQAHAEWLARSIEPHDQTNPIVLGPNNVLVSGLHRLEAHRILGRKTIRATVRKDLVGEEATLVRVHENIFRRIYDPLEFGEMATEGKQAHERLYPEARHGGASPPDKRHTAVHRAFAADAATKTWLSTRTLQEAAQIGGIAREARDLLRTTWLAKRKKLLLALSRLDEPDQVKVARLVAEGKKQEARRLLEQESTDNQVIEAAPVTVYAETETSITLRRKGRGRVGRIRIGERLIELRLERDKIRWVPVAQ